jgi:hypothetical protein
MAVGVVSRAKRLRRKAQLARNLRRRDVCESCRRRLGVRSVAYPKARPFWVGTPSAPVPDPIPAQRRAA